MDTRSWIGIAVCTAVLVTAEAQTPDNREVFLQASRVADDIELIREVMGRPYDDSSRLPASEVSDFELYFQSQTLFRKANQLAQDFGLADRVPPPAAPVDRPLTVADTHGVMTAAAAQIALVKDSLGIEDQLLPQRRQSGISSTGIFMTIIDVNRQLNLLLDEPIRMSDVFDQVLLAASYGGGILAQLEPSGVAPTLPEFDGHKTPADVYGQLLNCLDIVSRIAGNVGVNVMSLSSRRNIPDDIEAGHVYDVATIVVADLATLAIELDADGVLIEYPRPDRIFPTHVYDVGGLLMRQLQVIGEHL